MNIKEVEEWLETRSAEDEPSVKALKAVMELADGWESRAKHDRAYANSGSVPEEIIPSLEDAADNMQWNADMIRLSITRALEADIAE